ncbi:hypothetical protein [Corynebacterium sp. A21]|uniref:hypothetical protein n=1 Tax=Corynebacterium sp. A21 TaxID=3457318 RepID=UPI003FD38BB6
MKSSFIRTSAVAGMTALAGLAIAACSPSLQNASDLKVDTATEFQASSSPATTGTSATGTASATTVAVASGAPSFIDCVAAPAQTPETVSLSCADDSDSLTTIEWAEWGTTEATGTGIRETLNPVTGQVVTAEDVEIILATPIEGAQGLVFTELTVNGELVAP